MAFHGTITTIIHSVLEFHDKCLQIRVGQLRLVRHYIDQLSTKDEPNIIHLVYLLNAKMCQVRIFIRVCRTCPHVFETRKEYHRCDRVKSSAKPKFGSCGGHWEDREVYNDRRCSVCKEEGRLTGVRARTIRPPRSSSWERVSLPSLSRSQSRSQSPALSHSSRLETSRPLDSGSFRVTSIAPPPGTVVQGDVHPGQVELHTTPSVVPSGLPTQAPSSTSPPVGSVWTSVARGGSERAQSPARTVWTDATEVPSPTRTEWTDATNPTA